MSPEQLLGREVDQRSDIFAIGVMLFEALTGHLARSAELLDRTATSITLRENPLPVPLRAAIEVCLAVAPDHRPDSALALQQCLRPLLA
jgi:serine/threonine protein kinase